MPLHLSSMTKDSDNSELLAWILTDPLNTAELGYGSKEKKVIHLYKSFRDRISGEDIGRFVYTMKINEERKAIEIIDIDIVFDNAERNKLHFLELLDGSSDSNEYYNVEIDGESGHLQIETVNRHMIESEIIDTVQEVSISAFPFKLTLYDSIDNLNQSMGFSKPINVKGTEYTVHGFSERFIAPGYLFGAHEGETFSFIVGNIVDYRDVEVSMGDNLLRFVLAHLDTAVGVIPVPMSRDVFDLSRIKERMLVGMYADVKVDFANK